ncbi:putative PPE family protein PPE32 [Mycobacterium sp. MFM001]|uniref:PPE family protein n=1 Tax=Mycobacterium sp. MFM001 TaxID=2049453 RepID=UPI000DA51196|nr:PPE family protein [Mycobacterium sp. MFM001]GBE66441.1 putative PPE family protein PPE32 [Mycobacterium sp. MFM001]
MDFGAFPPEINSARMYSGPGSASMVAAASAWGQLAHELNSSAAAYGSVIAGLTTTGWQGPSSMMMANAIAPYVAWMHSTAAQAEQTSAQAMTAAGAYQSAFAMTVPPPLIEANRTQLTSLIASNFFGQNSPAIAATEADYDRMWAQDAAAMYGYAASSATASRLTPFTAPPRTTDPAGVAAQTAAAAQAAGSPAQAAAPQLLAQLPMAMQQLAAPAQAPAPPALPSPADLLLQIPSITSATASISSSSFSGAAIATTNRAITINAMRDEAQGIGPFLAGSTGPVVPAGVGGPAVSAGMGRASLVGTLSVPQTWAATATLPTSSATPLPAAPVAAETMPGSGMFGEALLGTLAGRGVSNIAGKMRSSVVPKSPAAG